METLDTYGHLRPGRDDETPDTVDYVLVGIARTRGAPISMADQSNQTLDNDAPTQNARLENRNNESMTSADREAREDMYAPRLAMK